MICGQDNNSSQKKKKTTFFQPSFFAKLTLHEFCIRMIEAADGDAAEFPLSGSSCVCGVIVILFVAVASDQRLRGNRVMLRNDTDIL